MRPGFEGRLVVAFERRRAAETEALIRNLGGEPLVVPAMEEAETPDDPSLDAALDALLGGRIDRVVALTGVGTRRFLRVAGERRGAEAVLGRLRQVEIAARGPKPLHVLREHGLAAAYATKEPHTIHDLLAALPPAPANHLLLEHGGSADAAAEALAARGSVLRARVYAWRLPDDTRPLEAALRRIVAGEASVVLFTSAGQALHVLEVARRAGIEQALLAALRATIVVSVGPVCSEALAEAGIPSQEASAPRLGQLVVDAARISRGDPEARRS